MSLATVLRAGVALAGAVVDSLRIDVAHEAWAGQDALGASVYAAPVTRRALVEPSTRRVVTLDGREVIATAHLLFFDAPPVSPQDRLTFPDGRQPPILSVTAPPLDADAQALCWDVFLGAA
jgi:hypothetical protein